MIGFTAPPVRGLGTLPIFVSLDAWTATKLLLHEPTAQLLAAAAAAADARRTAAKRDAELLAPPDAEGAHLVKYPLTPVGA
jgi:hypothetical protein